MSQATRNKIYAVVAAIVGVVATLGFFTQDDSTVILGLTEQGLDLASQIIAFVALVIATVNSLVSRVTTVKVAKENLDSVTTISGATLSKDAVTK